MKKFTLLILVCLVLVGCTNQITLYPQAHESAVLVCENNDGLVAYKAVDNYVASDRLYVSCNDGAHYELAFKKTMTSYTTTSGISHTKWEDYADHTWVIVQ